MLLSVLTFASCIKTEEVETTPECAIKTFSIGDIKSEVRIKRDGKSDTIVTRTISGASIYFRIDQVNGIITTTDSIASWANLSNIKPSFTANGNVFLHTAEDGNYKLIVSGSDSINMEKPVELYAVATNGISFKSYTVSIKKSSTDTNEFNWNKSVTNFNVQNDFNTLTLDNNVYVFFKNNEGNVNVTYSSAISNLKTWSNPININADIDYSSVTIFNDEFYALSTDGYIYKAEDKSAMDNWTKVSEKKFARLLSADKYYIYAFDGYEILSSNDLHNWTSNGKSDIDMLPNKCTDYYSYTSKTNPDIEVSMMCGINDNNKEYCNSWYKVSSKDEDINQNWMYIQITKDNPYGLPLFTDMSSALYKSSIYAIGINPKTNAYEYLYRSDDNGITWKPLTSSYKLPSDLDAQKGSARLVCANNKIWIIQKGGNIWSGTIK